MIAAQIAYSAAVTESFDDIRWQACLSRDPDADGTFITCVKTTGIFCRPTCTARPPHRRNVFFVETPEQAVAAGFRACLRCRPDLPPKADREAALVEAACRAIETAETEAPLAEIAAGAGLSPHHFHRLFKRIVGVTPKTYAAAKRQGRVRDQLGGGAAVTEAIYAAGYNSSGRFYEQAPAMLGMTPSSYRAGGKGQTIGYAFGDSSLGPVLVAATDRGVCAILIGDDHERLIGELRGRFPQAALHPLDAARADWVAGAVAAVDDPRRATVSALPFDIQGTAFQQRVWEALREIPPGETATYGALAARIGAPKAARAVGAACGANPLAVVVPCHRAVGASGDLTGYRWGVERKRRLLKKEAEG
jgi:AraC family transcriptional regulator, regulatory protein of adaptative response / methylated-DNA-[protein]-cysteine methyltransferase